MNKKTLGLLGFIVVVVLVGLAASGRFGPMGQDQLAAGGKGQGGGPGGGGGGATVFCSDSDGGANVAVKGVTQTYTVKNNGSQTIQSSFTDSCSGSAGVTEYSCSQSNIVTQSLSCANGSSCVDGACVVTNGGGGDTVAPSVSMLGFSNGSNSYTNSITVDPNASTDLWLVVGEAIDNTGVTGVFFMINGTNAISIQPGETTPIQSGSMYSMHIEDEIRARGAGTHTITMRACDAAGNCSISAGVTAVVEGSSTKGY